MTRSFKRRPAVRESVPLLIGCVGPSGGGKTYSALRLATGIQRIVGGDIDVIDTESRRALHYADVFRFNHVELDAPFDAMSYLAAIDASIEAGAKTIVIDSMSHEHEGQGGLLEQHESELLRMAGEDFKKRERCKMAAWIKPKALHDRFRNELLRRPANFILCFRAKEKMKLVRGKDPVALGWQAIGGKDLTYELSVSFLLMPGANGVPTWSPAEIGEREMVKLPGWAKSMFTEGAALDENTGELLARWSAGTNVFISMTPDAYDAIEDVEAFAALESKRRIAWPALDADSKIRIKEAVDAARERLGIAG